MLSKTKCRLGANRETSPRNDDPLNFDSLITASKWTSCNAEWQNKISSLCLNTVAGYSEEAPSILWVYHSYAYQYLLALVALISRWIQNFRRTAGLTSSAFHGWSIEQSVSVPTSLSVANRMQVITNKIHQNTLINGMRLFFPWEVNILSFSRASGRDSKQNRIYLQRN